MSAIDYQQEFNNHKTLFKHYDAWQRGFERYFKSHFPELSAGCRRNVNRYLVLKCRILQIACRESYSDFLNLVKRLKPIYRDHSHRYLQAKHIIWIVDAYFKKYPAKIRTLNRMRPLPGDSYEWLQFLTQQHEGAGRATHSVEVNTSH